MQNYLKSIKKEKFKPLKILKYPNEKLKRQCILVEPEKHLKNIQKLINEMFKTLKFYQGIGLTAPQVGVGFQVFVLDLQDGKTEPLSMINPEIIAFDGEITIEENRCLSLPRFKSFIKRSDWIKVKYLDYDGNKKELETNGLLSVYIQHNIDHLNGVSTLDKSSKLNRDMYIKSIKKRNNI